MSDGVKFRGGFTFFVDLAKNAEGDLKLLVSRSYSMKRLVKFSKNLILRDFTVLTWSEPEILGPATNSQPVGLSQTGHT